MTARTISPAGGTGEGAPAGDLTWQDQALCREVDSDIFFPDKGSSAAAAKRVCGLCEVQAECLLYAMAGGDLYGVFGGLSERERRALRRAS